MKCLTCAHFDLKAEPSMARVGFGQCEFDDVGEYKGISRNRACTRHKKAEEEVVAKREAWAAEVKRKGRSDAANKGAVSGY